MYNVLLCSRYVTPVLCGILCEKVVDEVPQLLFVWK